MSVVLEQEEIPEEGGEEKSWSDIMRKRIMQPLLQDEETCKTACNKATINEMQKRELCSTSNKKTFFDE